MSDPADPARSAEPVNGRAGVLRRAWARLPGGRLVRQAYVVVGGTAVAQVVQVLATPVLSRQYSPSDFGVLSVFLSLASIGYVVGSLRYEQAIALPRQERVAADVLGLTAAVCAATAAVTAVVVAVWRQPIADAVNVPELASVLWLLPLVMLAAGLYQALGLWSVRHRDFRRVSLGSVVQGVSLVGSQVAFGVLGLQPLGLVLGLLVAWGLGCVPLARRLVGPDAPAVRQVGRHGMRTVAHRYRRFPQLSVWSGLLNRSALEIPGIVLAALYSPVVSGLFLLGRRMMVAPAVLAGTSVQHVYLGEAARLAEDDPPRLEALYRRTWQRMLLLAIGPTVLLALLAPWAFELVFGPEWREAGVYSRLLAPVFLLQVTITPLTSTFAVLERQGLQLVRDVARTVLVIAGFVLCAALDLGPRVAVGLFSINMSIGYLLLFAFGSRAVRRHREAWEAAGGGRPGASGERTAQAATDVPAGRSVEARSGDDEHEGGAQ